MAYEIHTHDGAIKVSHGDPQHPAQKYVQIGIHYEDQSAWQMLDSKEKVAELRTALQRASRQVFGR